MSEPTMARLSSALADRYRIERELGQGGMATVYLAHDVRHERDVAIKVLHPELGAALGGDRFLSEIKTTARLQHPHILPLLDSGSADGLLYYVMPYVTGETLRARLDRERQLPIDDALRIAREVADALGAAHALGIVHRDIKPENILLQGAHATVADFGIALAVQSAAGTRMTQTGLSLGTPQYMSPEQAMGEKAIDRRADIYALGAVTYEMLTGDPPFTGSTVQAIVAKVLTERPTAPRAVRDTVPPAVEKAVLRALAKLPADRFASAAEFAAALAADSPTIGTAALAAAPGMPAAARRPRALVVAVAAVAMLSLVGGWLMGRGAEPAAAPVPLVHFAIDIEAAAADLVRFAVSPNGEMFAFESDSGIVVRDAGQRLLRVLPGTRGGESPSFSPDGEWISFSVEGKLRKIAVRGGSAIALVPGDSVLAGRVHWGASNQIVFEGNGGLYLVSSDGGRPRRLSYATNAASPRLLPDGSGVLFVDMRTGSRLMFHDIERDTTYTVLEESSEGHYADGYIVYGHPSGGLFAIRFDPARRRVEGAPIPLVDDLEPAGGVAPFDLSRNGMLVYRAGIEPHSRLLVVDPSGRRDTIPIAPRILSYVRFSPDGRQLAITEGSARGTNRHTSLLDLARGTLTQFTFAGGGHAPLWSPDGRRLAFTAEGEGTDAEDLFVQPVDRSAPPVRVARLRGDQHAAAWPDDSTLVFSDGGSVRDLRGGGNSRIVDPSKQDAQPQPFLEAVWSELDVAVAPDGRWAAYTSDESGMTEIFVRPFPRGERGARWKVSSGGGVRARWSPDGRSILFLSPSSQSIQRVDIRTAPDIVVGAPRTVLSAPGLGTGWDIDRRTGRIAVAQTVTPPSSRLIAVLNWPEILRRVTARP